MLISKWKQLGITLTKMHWLIRHKLKLCTSNKLLLYEAILKPIWTYGIQLCGTVSTSNIENLECFQSKASHMIVDTPWYVPNTVIRRDLETATVKEKNLPLQLSIQCPLIANAKELICLSHSVMYIFYTICWMYEGRTESHEQQFFVK
jgi:hypothetical protein